MSENIQMLYFRIILFQELLQNNNTKNKQRNTANNEIPSGYLLSEILLNRDWYAI